MADVAVALELCYMLDVVSAAPRKELQLVGVLRRFGLLHRPPAVDGVAVEAGVGTSSGVPTIRYQRNFWAL